ncbi:MAG: hypothetical protein PHC51_08250 [bacterium]|nr:hypothetical protein [bacterium]
MSKRSKSNFTEENDYESFQAGPFVFERHGRVVRIQSLLDKESHNEFKAHLRDSLDEQRQGIKSAIIKLQTRLSSVNPLSIVGAVAMRTMASHTAHPSGEEYIFSKMEYLVSHLASLSRPLSAKHPTGDDVIKTISDIDDVFKRTQEYFISEFANDSYTQHEQKLRFHLIINSLLVRGDSYKSLVKDRFDRFFSTFDSELQSTFGFSATDFWGAIEKFREQIEENIELYFSSRRDRLLKLVDDEVNLSTSCESGEIESIFSLDGIEDVFKIVPKNDIEGHVLRSISTDLGTNCKFTTIPNNEGWVLNLSETTLKPAVQHDGNYYLFCLQSLFFGIVEITANLVKQSVKKEEQFFRRRDAYVESEALNALSLILGSKSCKSYANLFYDDAELDGLIIYHNVAFIVEVKAGRIRKNAHRGHIQSFLDKMKNELLGKAFLQSERAYDYIVNNQRAEFYDAKGDILVTLEGIEPENIYCISVYDEAFGHIINDMSLMKHLGLVPHARHWAVSLDDLSTIAKVNAHPTFFLNYLDRRIITNELECLRSVDELDIYMFHMRDGLPLTTEPDSANLFFQIGDYTEELNGYFYFIEGQRPFSPKPSLKLSKTFAALIGALEEQKPKNFVTACRFLFNLSGQARDDLVQSIGKIEKRFRKDAGPHSVSMHFDDTVLVLIVPSDPSIDELLEAMRRKYLNLDKIKKLLVISWTSPIEKKKRGVRVAYYRR